jgi:WD40 repeat protein
LTGWYLWKQADSPVAVQKSKATSTLDPAIHSTSANFPKATGKDDNGKTTEKLPDTPVGSEKPWLVVDAEGHTEGVTNLFFTPDGQQLISISYDKTIRIWDLASGETVRVLRPPIGRGIRGTLRRGALSHDGKWLAVAGQRSDPSLKVGSIFIINLDTGRIEMALKGHEHNVLTMAFTPDRKRLAAGLGDSKIALYDLSTGRLEKFLLGHDGAVEGVAFSPDGQFLASAARGKQPAWIWSMATGKREQELVHPDWVNAIAWSADGKMLVTADKNALIRVFPAPGPKPEAIAQPLKAFPAALEKTTVNSITISRDGRQLLVTGPGTGPKRTANLIDLATGQIRATFPRHTNNVVSGTLSPDGKWAATTGGNQHEIFVWRTDDPSVVQAMHGKGQALWGVGWSNDGKSIAWGTLNRGTTDLSTPLERSFRTDELEFGAFPDPGSYRRAVRANGTYTLEQPMFNELDIKLNGQKVHTYKPEDQGEIKCFTLFGNDRALVGTEVTIYLVDLKTGKQLRYYAGHTSNVMSIVASPDARYFLSGGADQTLRIWDPELQEPLISLFVAGSEWIAWTQQGYYAASAGGERLMGWHINNGLDALATYHPAVQFRKTLYRPDVIKRVVPAGNVEKALALADQERKRPTVAVAMQNVLPPVTTIVSPKGPSGHRYTDAKLDVKVTARSVGTHPVTALRLLVDGRPYAGAKGIRPIAQPKLGEVQASWTVELPPGKHVLAVQAESAVSKGLSPFVEVVRTGGGGKAQLPNLHVLAAGISAYPGDLKLNYAASDSDMITRSLREGGEKVFQKIEVKLIKDKEATRAMILKELKSLTTVMTPQDVAVIFFSGHGAQDKDGNFYLVPVDIDQKDLKKSGVSGEQLKAVLAEMPGRVILILDACHSGAAADGGFAPGKALTDELVRELVTDDYGVIVMSSSLGREFSLESPAVKAGYFTLALVEGLSGKADYNRDSFIYLNELELYAAKRVVELSEDKQHPITTKPPSIRAFPLAKR